MQRRTKFSVYFNTGLKPKVNDVIRKKLCKFIYLYIKTIFN